MGSASNGGWFWAGSAALTHHNVIGRRGPTHGSLRDGGVTASGHSGELGLGHDLQTVATLPPPRLEVDIVCRWNTGYDPSPSPRPLTHVHIDADVHVCLRRVTVSSVTDR